MNHEQLDLRRELLDLAERIMKTGVQQGTFDPSVAVLMKHVLHVGMSNPDAGYRATAVSLALQRLAEGIAPAVHKPIDEVPSKS
jgi:hypothetical protein